MSDNLFATALGAIPGVAALGLIWWGPKDLPPLSPVVSCDSPVHCECAAPEACPNPWAFFVFGLLCGSVGLIAAWRVGSPRPQKFGRLPEKPRGQVVKAITG